jgi:hypothetical protein
VANDAREGKVTSSTAPLRVSTVPTILALAASLKVSVSVSGNCVLTGSGAAVGTGVEATPPSFPPAPHPPSAAAMAKSEVMFKRDLALTPGNVSSVLRIVFFQFANIAFWRVA